MTHPLLFFTVILCANSHLLPVFVASLTFCHSYEIVILVKINFYACCYLLIFMISVIIVFIVWTVIHLIVLLLLPSQCLYLQFRLFSIVFLLFEFPISQIILGLLSYFARYLLPYYINHETCFNLLIAYWLAFILVSFFSNVDANCSMMIVLIPLIIVYEKKGILLIYLIAFIHSYYFSLILKFITLFLSIFNLHRRFLLLMT